ncbi:hypothetical protein [Roseovarius aquimarinus]|uniref:Integral membrane protein n=1 Tax=Roseovarius aquimarinus TaxID=1229156 RepID=A0ABW7I736_9RHOB
MSDRREAGPPRKARSTGETSGAGYAVFVARGTYRQRRMIDAAGLLPVLGAILFALPLLWLGADGTAPRTSHVMIYLFVVWGALAFLSARITRGLRSDDDPEEEQGAEALADAAGQSATSQLPGERPRG